MGHFENNNAFLIVILTIIYNRQLDKKLQVNLEQAPISQLMPFILI